MFDRKIALSAILFALSATLWTPGPGAAQIQTIVTDHFRIHYADGAKGTARRVAEVAEEVFAPLAAAYDYYDDFSTIHVFVRDNSDMLGNGSADYYSNFIILWATNLDIELRGSHDWIKNVLTHELTHIMTLNKARKKWPFQFALFQVTRFDANPDISFNFPLYHLNAPRWWSEGKESRTRPARSPMSSYWANTIWRTCWQPVPSPPWPMSQAPPWHRPSSGSPVSSIGWSWFASCAAYATITIPSPHHRNGRSRP